MAMDAAPMLKRKGAEVLEELWLDEDPASGFPVSSRATKIRRLDAEVMPPVVPTAGVPPQPQPVARFGVEEVPMCGDVAPAANEERAIVVYKPAEVARSLLLGPLWPGVAPNGSTGSRTYQGFSVYNVKCLFRHSLKDAAREGVHVNSHYLMQTVVESPGPKSWKWLKLLKNEQIDGALVHSIEKLQEIQGSVIVVWWNSSRLVVTVLRIVVWCGTFELSKLFGFGEFH